MQCCPALQRLYASNNRFADVSPLASCPSLSLVGIHGNFLEDLAQALEVQGGGEMKRKKEEVLRGYVWGYREDGRQKQGGKSVRGGVGRHGVTCREACLQRTIPRARSRARGTRSF